MRLAAEERRIIVTYDLDFNLLLLTGKAVPGVILLRFPSTLGPLTVARLFQAFIEEGGLERVNGNLAVLTPGSARFRRLT